MGGGASKAKDNEGNANKLDKESDDNAGKKVQQCLWLCGNPGSGKTFLGDYLAARGWIHIDGDQGNQSKDSGVKEKWAKLYEGMTLSHKGNSSVDESLWRPYFGFLVEKYKEAIDTGKNVVLSFALLDLFGEKAYLKAEIPGLRFVIVEASEDILLGRLLKRNKEALSKAGTTEEEVWKQDYMKEYRERYGEEYTPERYRQMEVDGAKEQVYIKKDPTDTSIVTINNDVWENHSAIKELNALVGIEYEEVDADAISAVNMKRMENLNLEI